MAAPTKKPSKGIPPGPGKGPVVGNNTEKVEAGETVPMNYRVSPELKRNWKQFCASHDMSMVEGLEAALVAYMDQKGWGRK